MRLIRRKLTKERKKELVKKLLKKFGNHVLAKRTIMFSKVDDRENASPEVIKKAKESGVVQKINGKWRIVAIKKKKLWSPKYETKENAEKALAAYHANKH